MRRHGFLAAMLLGTAVTTGWVLHRYSDLDASEENSRSFREALSRAGDPTEADEDPECIKLNYFEATWDRVLRNVAEQQQLTLIMENAPPGRFARRDKRRYDLKTTVRILNSELEPQGFRLLQQGEYLIVLDLDKARTEYARPRLGSSNPVTAASAAEETADNAEPLIRSASRRTERKSQAARPVPSGVPVKSASHSAVTDEQADESSNETQSSVESPAPVEVQAVVCSNTRAADLARTIYLAFEKRAELQRDGVEGLPTFAVFAAPSEGEVEDSRVPMFRIGIDQTENRLLIEASQPRLKYLRTMIGELDKPAGTTSETVRILPSNGLAEKTAKDLNDQIHQLVSMRAAAAARGNGGGLFPQQEQQSDPAAQDPMPEAAAPDESPSGPGSALNLRGDVNIQAIPELGLLLLKGNDPDLKKVAEIIAQLEQMSIGSLPEIHLHTLKNVNSEAMAELMTSVYDRLSELRQRGTTTRKTSAFIAVVQPNAVLILSPKSELEEILKLANELDQPLDPEFEFQVFPLKSAIASQVVTAIESLYTTPTGLRTRPRVVADVRTNSVIVQGRANDLKEVGKLVEKIDKDESGAVHRVQIFPLKNAVAEELSTTISSAIQAVTNPPQQTGGQFGGLAGLGGGTQGAQELRASKSVALEFLASDGNARQLVKSGILADVRVNSDARTNSLIVSAPEASMGLMSALIAELDKAPSATAEIKVFTLKNADAEQSVTLLETLFENQNNEDQLGIQISGTEGQASSLIPLRFSADIRTNTVMAVGGAEALSVVEAVLLRLDTSDVRQRLTEVIPLRNAAAEQVSVSLTNYLEQQAALQDSSEDLISNIERLRQEVIIAEDINSNSLIVSASPQYFSRIRNIIESLDAKPPEVVISALIVEVSLDETDEFGIELGFQDPLLLGRSNITSTTAGGVTSTTASPGLNFNNTSFPLGNNIANAATNGIVATQGLSNFSLGRQNTDLGFGGFVFSAQSDAVSILLRALAARRTVHILSRPQIRTTHNNPARVNVGQNVPIVTGANVNQLGTANPNIDRIDTGITLLVTPRVSPEGLVAMRVFAEKSILSGAGVPVFVNTDGSTIESPIINQSVAETLVNVPNGQTIVIGGMITKADSTLERKVPWLGDLPIVGKAFRYDGTTTSRTELLIFLTPRVITSDIDSELIKQIESERLHFIESEAEEMHGPLYSVPPSSQPSDHLPYLNFNPSTDLDTGLPPQSKANTPVPDAIPDFDPTAATDSQSSGPKAKEEPVQQKVQPVKAERRTGVKSDAASNTTAKFETEEKPAKPLKGSVPPKTRPSSTKLAF